MEHINFEQLKKDYAFEGATTLFYLPEIQDPNKPVIVKIQRNQFINPETAQDFENEFIITNNLQIKGVRRAIEKTTINGKMALILEYIEGETLKNLFAAHQKRLTDILEIAISAVNILVELHKNSIIHKNLNSENIIVNKTNFAVSIIDFSIASKINSLNKPIEKKTNIKVSLPYISPEQTGRINLPIDHRSDLYSLGIVLYELITGTLPFNTTNASELLHNHIAKTPLPVRALNEQIPKILSDIVDKLLAKDPKNRYQTALGLLSDLKKCLDQFKKHGTIKPFEIAMNDFTGTINESKKCIAREEELKLLKESYKRIKNGDSEVILVTGVAGVGKTFLINEFQNHTAATKALTISVKYNMHQKNTPYSAIIDALKKFIDQLLIENSEDIALWKSTFLKFIGSGCPLLSNTIPSLELILGKQPSIPKLRPNEAQVRFNYAFLSLIKAIIHLQHSLVLLIDNFQWADEPSINLLNFIISNKEITNLMVVFAYRENEENPKHPLKSIEENQTKYLKLNIDNLSPESLNLFISNALSSNPKDTDVLTRLIYEKTEGNLFFSQQFLHSIYNEKLLYFNFKKKRWNWIENKIQDLSITDNVIQLISQKINKLPVKNQELLSVASFIGNKFNLKQLAIVSDIQPNDILDILNPSINERFIVKQNEKEITDKKKHQSDTSIGFEFIHDNIRQAANALINRKTKKTISLEIGRKLLSHTSKNNLEKNIYVLADLLNEGFQYVINEQEKRKLSEINLLAGQKSKMAGSYNAAIWYLSMGIGVLPSNKWVKYFELTLSLYLEAAESEYLSANFDRAELLSNEILKHAKDVQTKIKVYELRILFFSAQFQYKNAINSGFEALQILNVRLPATTEEIRLLENELKEELLKRNNQIDELQFLPELKNKQQLLVMRILSRMTAPSNRIKHKLLPVIITKMVLISIRNGNSAISAYAYAWYAAYLCETTKNINLGYEFGLLSVKMLSVFDSMELAPKINYLFHVFVKHWKHPLKTSLNPLQNVFDNSIETGNLEYCLYSAIHYTNYLFLSGGQLEIIDREHTEYMDKIQRYGLNVHSSTLKIWNLTIKQLLSGNSGSSLADELNKIPTWLEQNLQLSVFSAYLCQTILNYTEENYSKAIEMARLAEQHQKGGEGYFYIVSFRFYYALALIGGYPQADNKTKKEYQVKINSIISQLKEWSDFSPANFTSKYELITAEVARINGDKLKAIEFYGLSIKEAKEHGYINEEAIAYECEAKFYLSIERVDIGSICMQKSLDAYILWGAKQKSTNLETKYKYLLKKNVPIDTNAIINASLVLSQELRLEELLKKLIHIVIENAGAEKGILLENQDGKLVLQAKGEALPDKITTMLELPVLESKELPLSVINHVARTFTPIVLDNAMLNGLYNSDPYIKSHKVKSLLCCPIVHQGKLMGILYIENNLSTGIFTLQRLELLLTLSTQAAISMVNARLYSDLEQKITEIKKAEEALIQSQKRYRSLFEDSPISLWEEDFSAVKSYLDDLKASGITNYREYFKSHPETVAYCSQLVKVTDINKASLALTKAKNKHDLLAGIDKVFFKESFDVFLEELIVLAEGKTKYAGEAMHGTFTGEKITVLIHISVVPGYENSLGKVLVSIQDITSRKQSEEILQQNEYRLSTLLKLNQMQNTSTKDILKFTHEESIKLTKSKYGYLAYLNEAEDVMTMQIWSKNAMDECRIIDKPFVYPLETTGLWGEAVRLRKPVITNDYKATNPLKKGYPKGHVSLTRHMNVPVFSGSKIVLVAGVGNKESDYDETDVQQLTLLMEGMWRLIEKKKAEEEIHKLNQELEQRVSERTMELEAANKELEAFSYSVSHDLRAPIRHIDGYIKLLKKHSSNVIDDKSQQYMKFISSATKSMGIMIDDLLSFSRMGRQALNKQNVNLSDLVKETILEFRLDVEGRDIQWDIAKLPVVFGDRNLLRAVLINLISNAIKYTRTKAKAKIKIGYKKTKTEIIIFISDNGVGFNPDYTEKLFGVFQRLHSSKEFEGTGIGLANIRRIILRHNGKVWAKGEVDKGATFYFSLPL